METMKILPKNKIISRIQHREIYYKSQYKKLNFHLGLYLVPGLLDIF